MSTRLTQSSAFTGETTPLRLGVLEWLFVFGSVLVLEGGFFLTLPDILTAVSFPGGGLSFLLAAMVSTTFSLHFRQHARALEWLGCLGCALTWLNVVFHYGTVGAPTAGSLTGWAVGFILVFGLIGLFGFLLNCLPLWSSSLGAEREKLIGFYMFLYLPGLLLYSAGAVGGMMGLYVMGVHPALPFWLLGTIALWGLHAEALVRVYLPSPLRARLHHALWAEQKGEDPRLLIRNLVKVFIFGVLPLGTLNEFLRGNWAVWLGSLLLLGIVLRLNWATAWAGAFQEERPSPAVESAPQVEIPDLINNIKFLVVSSLVTVAELTLLVTLAILLQG